MSGDVQPRKRKDKKRKKDELSLEEPRGTAAALGEGDVFMHSYHDHGTGGHWCAKIIFFSLLAILVTLIGLIILENRGLSELEANSVESRYSGVLEGWLEDAPEDDHHDEHTLELNHHDDDDDGHDEDVNHVSEEDHADEDDDHDDEHADDDDDEHGDEDDDDDDENGDEDDDEHADEDEDDHGDDDDDEQGDEDEEDHGDEDDDESNYNDEHLLQDDDELDQQSDNDEDGDADENDDHENDEDNEDEDELHQDSFEDDDNQYQADEGDDNNDDLQQVDDDDENTEPNEIDYNDEQDNDENEDTNQSAENYDDNKEDNNEDDDEEEEHDEHESDEEVEVEQLEKEVPDEEPISVELPALPEDDDDDKGDDGDDSADNDQLDDEDNSVEQEDEEFLEADDTDEPPIERITVPAGKPLVEVEEEESSEQPPDTLAEEEEYEKRQEELRKEEAQSSHMWLKLTVGGALLVATHAVMRRATRPRDTPESEEQPSREETPVIDRRMTLLPEQHSAPVRKIIEEVSQPVIEKVVEKMTPVIRSVPIRKEESEEEEEDDEEKQQSEDEEVIDEPTKDKELYSDEDEPAEELEEEEEEEIVVPKKEIPKQSAPVAEKKPEPESEEEIDPDDVEIIGDEQLEDEMEEEDDEEEISDVDDAELLSRLEAKYGRLPEPERPGQKHKDGGNSVDDAWPGEPSDAYWRQQLDSAERELRQGAWSSAGERSAAPELRASARARYVFARALDAAAEAQRDNRLLTRAITAYLDLLKMNERLSDKKLLEVTGRTLDRIQFRGNYLSAEPVYRLLIRRFPNDPSYRNNLTISFLMANRADLAEQVLKETLKRWPDDRIALAHYAFVLKTQHNNYEKAVELFQKALEGDTGAANEPRFYYHYGDSLLLLGRPDEAHKVHERGAKLGHFLSASQRSLYNVPRLKGSPWWNVEDTPYLRLAKALEKSWKEILKEGEAAKALYEQEKEGLKEKGEWSQLDLFVRGQEIPDRCKRAPVTCAIIKGEPAAAGCRRGQVKFSLMAPGTHVRAHVGPTNCRLRMHLGLSNTKDTYLRVDKEIRQWSVGRVLLFDDSFEHEVWHNGTRARLVLIVDVWHPQLTAKERRQLPAI
ncbi:aspartyl/asparaginyl beta-hydroxylase isoform X1 [Ostrinia furnacalis]|uniref:aspartyl/asparaginyl beta-hydroxylase isoform X1 n=1 Tax=Ostrinia furnacalis TaxID=93504 RepID=UPI00103BBEF1|nr:aspartyl/asparaginyl beta-hydroxylase isoform X1 [Ostrinia furnacalis]XP_028176356.1 aspartyl/asparaginyl beta-hydroxylase isoform X1 [Ostrinia furnacalis]